MLICMTIVLYLVIFNDSMSYLLIVKRIELFGFSTIQNKYIIIIIVVVGINK